MELAAKLRDFTAARARANQDVTAAVVRHGGPPGVDFEAFAGTTGFVTDPAVATESEAIAPVLSGWFIPILWVVGIVGSLGIAWKVSSVIEETILSVLPYAAIAGVLFVGFKVLGEKPRSKHTYRTGPDTQRVIEMGV